MSETTRPRRRRAGSGGTSRVEAYSDAVFAIAATLLVLDLTTASFGEIGSDADMWAALAGLWPNVSSFAVSFALLSGMWMIHLRQFRDIADVDTTLLWLNNARLLFVVLIPFTTALTSQYSDFLAGRVLLPVDFFLVALFGHLSWRWAAARGGQLLLPEAVENVRAASAGGISAVTCAAVAVALSPWIGSYAFLAFLLNGVLAALILRLTRPHPAGDAAGADTAGADGERG